MKKAMNSQIKHLENKHYRLDLEVDQLVARPHMTPSEYQQVVELKKRKLLVKDGLEALRQDQEA
jgi:hypothetical protein